MNDVNVAELSDEMGPLHLDQTSLAAALGVTQAAVSQWASGRRRPSPSAVEKMTRALSVSAEARETIGTDTRGRAITAPKNRWTPVFNPTGKFRLPINVEWSGNAKTRWRDAKRVGDLIGAYTLVIEEGSVEDVLRWVDPLFVADHWDRMPLSRAKREPWRNHLTKLGYLKERSNAAW